MDPTSPRGIRSSINISNTFNNDNHLFMELLPAANPLPLLHVHAII